jgi:hypothetical protein
MANARRNLFMGMYSEVDVKQSDLPTFHATHVGTACQRDLRKIAIHGLVLLQCPLSDVSPIWCSYERKRFRRPSFGKRIRRLPQANVRLREIINMPGLHR